MTILVYTAWFGEADTLKPAPTCGPDVRFVCFTDRAEAVQGWRMERMSAGQNPRLSARLVKMNPPTDADVSIWMDASFELLMDPRDIVAAAVRIPSLVVAFVHPDRARMSDEAAVVSRLGLAAAHKVSAQVAMYQAAGFDTEARPQSVLTATGLLVRWSHARVTAFNARWYDEVTTHTLRDQLSVDYAAWVTGMPVGYLEGHYRDNRYVRYDRASHRKGRVAA